MTFELGELVIVNFKGILTLGEIVSRYKIAILVCVVSIVGTENKVLYAADEITKLGNTCQ
jgi:hypothetical protein